MKLSEVQVPDEFRAKYVLSAQKLRAQKAGLFIIPKRSHDGKPFPRGPLRVKSAYPEMDAVKLVAENRDEFIVRRTEVSTVKANEISREWLMELFRRDIERLRSMHDIQEAVLATGLSEGAPGGGGLRRGHQARQP